jgi:hypothetical protein
MIHTNYAANLPGLMVVKDDGGSSYYRADERFSAGVASELIRGLPPLCELSFFDPEAKGDEGYVFVRRAELKTMVMRVRHGCFPPWAEDSAEAVARLLLASPFVARPSPEWESFRVSVIPEHQRRWHIDGSFKNDHPWWMFWRQNA